MDLFSHGRKEQIERESPLANRMRPRDLEEFAGQDLQAEIVGGRDQLVQDILVNSSQVTPNFGIELVDVQFKRINYVEEVRRKVYDSEDYKEGISAFLDKRKYTFKGK